MNFRIIFYLLFFHGYSAFIASREKRIVTSKHSLVAKISSSAKIKFQRNNHVDSKKFSLVLSQAADTQSLPTNKLSVLPRGDDIDRKIFQIALPALLNFAIVPLIGAIDTFWIGRMKNAYALAGQGAAIQLFNSAFWFFSFLPSVITPLIAKAQGRADHESIRARISEAVFIATIMGMLGTISLGIFPHHFLSLILKSPANSPVASFAQPYLRIRALTFLPSLLSTVGFAAFRGLQDVVTPLKISILANIMNLFLDPLLIFAPGRFGVIGAAIATCIAELAAFLLYVKELTKRDLLVKKNGHNTRQFFLWGLVQVPKWKQMAPLLLGGLTMQIRAIALNTAILAVTRASQRIDHTGTVAAAHAVSSQLFQLGSIASLAMSTVASVLIPLEVSKAIQYSSSSLPEYSRARNVSNRLLVWGLIVGVFLALLQLVSLPVLALFTPLKEVQDAARLPAMIGALLQFLNCFIWTGEGIQQGLEEFGSLAISTIAGTVGMLISLHFAADSLGKVWMSFVVLALIRLVGVLRHHFVTSPLIQNRHH